MIVIGTDTHKRTHTCGAVDALTAAGRGELTVPARKGGFGRLLRWARVVDRERAALAGLGHLGAQVEAGGKGTGCDAPGVVAAREVDALERVRDLRVLRGHHLEVGPDLGDQFGS